MGVEITPFVQMSERSFLQCRDYQRKQKRNGRSFWMPKRVGVLTTTFAANVRTTASKVLGQLLSVVRNTTPKEVWKMHQIATILMILDKTRNYVLTKFKSFTKRKITNLYTFFIQKNGVSIHEGSESFWTMNFQNKKRKPLLLWEFQKHFLQIHAI